MGSQLPQIKKSAFYNSPFNAFEEMNDFILALLGFEDSQQEKLHFLKDQYIISGGQCVRLRRNPIVLKAGATKNGLRTTKIAMSLARQAAQFWQIFGTNIHKGQVKNVIEQLDC